MAMAHGHDITRNTRALYRDTSYDMLKNIGKKI